MKLSWILLPICISCKCCDNHTFLFVLLCVQLYSSCETSFLSSALWNDTCLMTTSCYFWCHYIPYPTVLMLLTECHYYLHVKISFSAHSPVLSGVRTENWLQYGGSWWVCCCSGAAWGGSCFCYIPGYTLFFFSWEGRVIASIPCYVIK